MQARQRRFGLSPSWLFWKSITALAGAGSGGGGGGGGGEGEGGEDKFRGGGKGNTASQTTVLHIKRLNQTEYPIFRDFVCSLFPNNPFWFLL